MVNSGLPSFSECVHHQTPRIPNSYYYYSSVTKSVKWRYLGNQAWYHRSAGVKTTGEKNLNKKIKEKNSQWPIFKKCPIFTGSDLKRARHTVLSAQRARRTKSRGPKGLQQEVGARRAPRLLVNKYSGTKYPPVTHASWTSWTSWACWWDPHDSFPQTAPCEQPHTQIQIQANSQAAGGIKATFSTYSVRDFSDEDFI